MKTTEVWRAASAEFLATMLFVFAGAGSVVSTGAVGGDELTSARLVAIAGANGLAIAVLAYSTAAISGGHMNPAVTFATVVTGQIGVARGAAYVAAQLAGALAGAYLLMAVVPEADRGTLGAHALGAGVGAGTGLLAEGALTFLLVFVIFATAIDARGPKNLAPLAIGLAVAVDQLVGIPFTGASMNPARSLGPAVAKWIWADHWIYWLGPLIGAASAGLAYKLVYLNGRARLADDGDMGGDTG